MKRFFILLVVPLLAVILAIPAMAQVDLPYSTDLIADGCDTALDVGDLTIDENGVITFQIDEENTDWRLEETHLYVGDAALVKSSPGQFPYKDCELGGLAVLSYETDLAAIDENGDGIVYVAAHACLVREVQIGVDEITGEPIYGIETESAWAQGDEPIGKGSNWATQFTVNVPEVVIP